MKQIQEENAKETGKSRISEVKEKAVAITNKNKGTKVITATVKSFLENEVMVYSGASTLKILTAVFPLFMLAIAVVTWLPGYSPEDFAEIMFSVLPDLPEIKSLFAGVLTNLKSQSNGLLASFAVLTTLWSASAGVSSIQNGLKKVMPPEGKGLNAKLVSLLFTLGLIVMIPVVLFFKLFSSSLSKYIENAAGMYGVTKIIEKIIKIIHDLGFITPVIGFVIILLVYCFLPGGRRKMRDQLPGAVFSAVAWFLFTRLFSVLMPIFWKSSVYGSLASLFMTILWLQICIMILLIGGALNQAFIDLK